MIWGEFAGVARRLRPFALSLSKGIQGNCRINFAGPPPAKLFCFYTQGAISLHLLPDQAGTLFTLVILTTSSIFLNPRMTLAKCTRLETCKVKYSAV